MAGAPKVGVREYVYNLYDFTVLRNSGWSEGGTKLKIGGLRHWAIYSMYIMQSHEK